ncbi:MAG TPA: carboxypeptidase-like regulatory domain-containing protein, partial [Bryobacteraceae bacterium]|nr:carboxypeptidase-like regulatory domain-containing protein [Bryobacteraceae bacterium]
MKHPSFRSAALLLLCSFAAFAQKDTAALVGRVLDPSGASVPGAAITATDTGTNFTYRAASDTAGEWAISPVRIGSYRVSIKAKGFKTSEIGPITLDVQQRRRIDVSLQPGEVRETVQVQETAPLLETDTSERG